jgi:hypothetical protein
MYWHLSACTQFTVRDVLPQTLLAVCHRVYSFGKVAKWNGKKPSLQRFSPPEPEDIQEGLFSGGDPVQADYSATLPPTETSRIRHGGRSGQWRRNSGSDTL